MNVNETPPQPPEDRIINKTDSLSNPSKKKLNIKWSISHDRPPNEVALIGDYNGTRFVKSTYSGY